jgi:hypothetical protein
MNFFPQNVPEKFSPLLLCQICGKPVPVETSKTDAQGKAIHENCYIKTIALEQAITERGT